MYLLKGVGRMAFGSILSPQFRNADLGISAVPTGKDVALPASVETLHFHVFLPETPAPPGGYPVVIAPGGAGGGKWWHSILYASVFAFHGN